MQGVLNASRGEGYYLLQKQEGWGWMTVLVRPSGNPDALVQPIREIVAGLAANQPVHSIGVISKDLDQRLAVPRFISRMFIVFGAAALFLGALGLYGVMSFSVNQRTREFGIRFALGARVGDVLRMVFRQGSIQLVGGLIAGLLLAFALSRPLAFLLAGVSPTDPFVYGAVAIAVAAIALVAIWLPARRASRIDPMLALRNE
jgi:putative ABC transport system permease protein